ncbi:MAG: twin-arginine translocase TatA/TatE family subunit [Microbacteriaceae bacterium]
MGNLFSGPHFWIALIVIVLVFGASRLPGAAKALGQALKIFRNEVKSDKTDTDESSTSDKTDK